MRKEVKMEQMFKRNFISMLLGTTHFEIERIYMRHYILILL